MSEAYRNYAKTLESHINESYEDFDLTDKSFSNYAVWHNNVPQKIKDIWFVLQTDERFLVALTATYNIKH